MDSEAIVGIDVGGTWIKGALVRVESGELISEPLLVLTPQPVMPRDVVAAVTWMVSQLADAGAIGVTLPCIVEGGTSRSASNIDPSWIDLDAARLFANALQGRNVVLLNDADAAGLAEAAFGAAKGMSGKVLVLTFGTGIGSALLHEGDLVPNTEVGHLRMPDGQYAERYVGPCVHRGRAFDWKAWCDRVNGFLTEVDLVVRPNVVVIGGGISVAVDVPRWIERLHMRPPIVPAVLRNNAGIVGAAMAAHGVRRGAVTEVT
jgi:polyphosphate glucokinase